MSPKEETASHGHPEVRPRQQRRQQQQHPLNESQNLVQVAG